MRPATPSGNAFRLRPDRQAGALPDGGTLLQVTAEPEPVVAPLYPTGRRRHNRIGVLRLALAVLAAVVAAFSGAAIALAVVAGAHSFLGIRRPRRPTFASRVGLGFSVAAVVTSIAVAVAATG